MSAPALLAWKQQVGQQLLPGGSLCCDFNLLMENQLFPGDDSQQIIDHPLMEGAGAAA